MNRGEAKVFLLGKVCWITQSNKNQQKSTRAVSSAGPEISKVCVLDVDVFGPSMFMFLDIGHTIAAE